MQHDVSVRSANIEYIELQINTFQYIQRHRIATIRVHTYYKVILIDATFSITIRINNNIAMKFAIRNSLCVLRYTRLSDIWFSNWYLHTDDCWSIKYLKLSKQVVCWFFHFTAIDCDHQCESWHKAWGMRWWCSLRIFTLCVLATLLICAHCSLKYMKFLFYALFSLCPFCHHFRAV